MKLTRRGLMQGAAAFSAAAALPRPAARAAEPSSSVIGTLSAYMSEAQRRTLPAEALEKTKHHILDTFAAMVSGADLPPGRVALQFARAHSGEKVATVASCDVLCGADRGSHGERDAGAFRRNRRLARSFTFSSRLRGRSSGARGRRTVRDRRNAISARRGARLRHRAARDHDARRAALSNGNAPQHP